MLMSETWARALPRSRSLLRQRRGVACRVRLRVRHRAVRGDNAARGDQATGVALGDKSWPLWNASNHDIGRFATRWAVATAAERRCRGPSRRGQASPRPISNPGSRFGPGHDAIGDQRADAGSVLRWCRRSGSVRISAARGSVRSRCSWAHGRIGMATRIRTPLRRHPGDRPLEGQPPGRIVLGSDPREGQALDSELAAGAASSLRQAGPDGTTDSNRSKLPRGPRPGVRRPRLSCTQDACTEEDAQCRHCVRGGRRVRPGCWRKRMFGGAKSGYELRVAAQHNAEQPPGDGERALMGWRGRGWPLAHRPGSGRAKKERPRRSADG